LGRGGRPAAGGRLGRGVDAGRPAQRAEVALEGADRLGQGRVDPTRAPQGPVHPGQLLGRGPLLGQAGAEPAALALGAAQLVGGLAGLLPGRLGRCRLLVGPGLGGGALGGDLGRGGLGAGGALVKGCDRSASLKEMVAKFPSLLIVTFVAPTRSDQSMLAIL